jgi:3-oxoacyl-[acyl-carrier protein] reductase
MSLGFLSIEEIIHMDLRIANRRALVLGASRGLGAAIARALLAEGVTVYGAARDARSIERLRASVDVEASTRLHSVQLDLARPGEMIDAARRVLDEGPIDILLNNSGGPPPASARAVQMDRWIEQFQQMAVSLFALTNALVPAMLERRWGRILTIASSGVEQPIPDLVISNAIRSSIVGWSKTLAAEVAAQGVTVNVLIPGRILTSRLESIDQAAAVRQSKTVAEIVAASVATIPAGRYGTPEEFADAAAFLASDRAAYITGSLIRIDGGLIRSI